MSKKTTNETKETTTAKTIPDLAPGARQAEVQTKKYAMWDFDAIENAAALSPWGYGTGLSAKLKGRDWAMPAGAGITQDGTKLMLSVPADAIVAQAEELQLPEPLVKAAEFKAGKEGRNLDREAHVILGIWSRKPTLKVGVYTAWQRVIPEREMAVVSDLFEAVGPEKEIVAPEGEVPVADVF